MDFDWIDLMYEADQRKAAFECVKANLTDPVAVKTLADLEKGYTDLSWEYRFLDRFLEQAGDWVYEISSSTPAPEGATGRSSESMAKYWRWTLFEDCMGNVPDQVERTLQALVGTAFDAGLREPYGP